MLKHLLLSTIMCAMLLGSPALADPSDNNTPLPYSYQGTPQSDRSLHQYNDEASAQAHCPNDEVVWLNTNSGIYHEKGMRWYGSTESGAYVCREEADAAGDRDTRNGQ